MGPCYKEMEFSWDSHVNIPQYTSPLEPQWKELLTCVNWKSQWMESHKHITCEVTFLWVIFLRHEGLQLSYWFFKWSGLVLLGGSSQLVSDVSDPHLSTMERPFGRGTILVRGLTNNGHILTTYKYWDDPPSSPTKRDEYVPPILLP